MDLISFKAGNGLLKYFLLGLLVVGVATFSGCASTEETMSEEDEFGSSEEMVGEQAPAEEQQEESADQQALTSFIGEKPVEETETQAPPPAEVTPPTATLEAQMEELRTENTSLKQQLVKLEQDNRSLGAQLSDTEAKLIAEKERADKAEEAAKAMPTGITRGADMSAAPVPVSATAYDEALQSFRSKNYDDTIVKLRSLLDGGVTPELTDNCNYWLGEANFGKRNYAEAIGFFEKVFDFKKSEKFADAQFMIAKSYERLGEKAKAKDSYEKVVKDFPTSRLVGMAKRRAARL